jgi:hypothetical protein
VRRGAIHATDALARKTADLAAQIARPNMLV